MASEISGSSSEGADGRLLSSPDRLEPSFYRHWIEDTVRFSDLDPLGHCNNAAINGFFESSRVALVADAGFRASGGHLSIPIVRTEIDFRRELLYRTRVRIGARILKLGRTSFTLAGAVFDGDECAAAAQVVAVLFDLTNRRSVEIPAGMREALSAYI
jgi:acyl-CoA thioester hydrolase